MGTVTAATENADIDNNKGNNKARLQSEFIDLTSSDVCFEISDEAITIEKINVTDRTY